MGTLCIRKKCKIIEAEVCLHYAHMLLESSLKTSVSNCNRVFKGKNDLMIYEKYPEMRYKYRNREFWYLGYDVDTAGKDAKKIEEYIQHQPKKDQAKEQFTREND